MKDGGVASQLNTSGGANTYRYKSFNDRLNDIKTNVPLRIVRDFDEPEENQSYFAEGLKRQGELNCTKDYTEFTNRVAKYQQSLAQVLYHKEDIVSAMEEYLTMEHELVLESMLDLVTTLARDLQEEVLPYFARLVQRIMHLIKVDSAEIVEAACNALTYLFKYLSKWLVTDLRPTFDLLKPLLGMEKQKPNVRRFAAESLAFLIRKLRADSLQRFVAHVIADLNACVDTRKVDFRDGLALLFFECMRQVNSQLHSRAAGTLTALLREMSAQQQQEETAGALEDCAVYVLVVSVLKLCLHHVQRDTAQQLWAVLTMEFDAHMGRAQRMEPHALVALTGLLATATVVRKGSRVADYAGLFQRCRSTFELTSECELLAYERLRWLTALLMQCGVAEMVGIGRVLLDLAVEREPLERILGMALTLARLQWPQWSQIMLPYAVQLTVKHWQADRLRLLLFWATVFQLGLVQPPSASGAGLSAVLTRRGHVLFPTAAAAAGAACGVNVARELLAWLAEPVAWGDIVRHPMALPAGGDEGEFRGFDSTDESAVCTELATRSAVLEVIARVAIDTPELMRSLDAFAQELTQAIIAVTQELAPVNAVLSGNADQGEEAAAWADDEAAQALGQDAEKAGRLYWGAYHQAAPLVSLLGRTLRLLADNALQMAAAAEASALLHKAWLLTLDNVVATHPANAALMDGLLQVGSALQLLASAKAQPTTALGEAQLASLLPLVERNLGSFQAALRLKTLQLLALFEQQPMSDGSGGRCEMIAMAAALEATDAGFDTHKDRMNHLRRMAVFACNGNVPALYRNVFPRIALAQFSVNFRPVWADAAAQLARLAAAAPELFWASTWQLLRCFDDERRLIEPGLTPAAKAWLRARAAECAAQTAFGAQPKVDGHALECPNVVRLARVFAADRAQAAAAPGVRLQELMVRAGGAEGAAAAATERVDYANVQRLLLRLLADHGVAAAERHSRPLVRAFLSFARHALDWTAAFYRRGQVADDLELGAACAPRFRGLLTGAGRKAREAVCELWLGVFARMRSPRSLHQWPALHALFTRMLARGDSAVQRRALDCVLAWRDPALAPYADHLRNLLDEKRFRDELGSFNLAVGGQSINEVHRGELLPVVFRILHGQTLVRQGKAARKDGMKIRRAAVLTALAGVTPQELRLFVAIGLESFTPVLQAATPLGVISTTGEQLRLDYAVDAMDVDGAAGQLPIDRVSPKAQLSFLHLLAEMVRQLGFKVAPVLHDALVVLLSAVEGAERQIAAANAGLLGLAASEAAAVAAVAAGGDEGEGEAEAEDHEEDDDEDDDDGAALERTHLSRGTIEHRKSVARDVRHLALKCLAEIFTLHPPNFSFAPYMPCIYAVAINPRLAALSAENTQNSSVLLRLLKAWTLTPDYFAYLTAYNEATFPTLLDLLVAPKVQPEVVALVLDVLQTFLDYSPEDALQAGLTDDPRVAADAALLARDNVQKHVSRILSHMRTCFATVPFTPAARGAGPAGQQQQQGAQGGALAMRQIHILSRVAEYATSQAADARALLDLLLPILRKPNAAVPERTKGHVLRMMVRFVPIVLAPEAAPPATLLPAYLDVVSACFGRLRLDGSRTTLAEIMQLLAGFSSAPALVAAAEIVRDINSLSQERLGGADFEVRLGGYARLNERLWAAPMLDSHAWVPLLHNLTFFAQDHEEMSIRSNAAYGLARFITRLASALRDDPLAAEPETRSLGRCLTAIVLPAIRHAFNSKYEIVREEYLGVLRRAVRECGAYFDELRDLMALDSKDEEINFFYNIVHVQIHRRLRALRRFRALVNTKPIDQGAGAVDAESMDVDAEEEDSEDDAGSASDNEEIGDALAKKKPAVVEQKPKADRSSLAPLNLTSANNSSSETASPISQPNIRGLFMPLLEHWALAESAAEVNHELTHEAILTIGALGAILPWSQYSSAMRKYLAMMKKSPEMEKRLTRLVLALLDNFHYDLRQVKVDHMGRLLSKRDVVQVAPLAPALVVSEDAEMAGNEQDEDEEEEAVVSKAMSADERHAERIHEGLVWFLLPELKKKISDTNEDNMALRAPLAMAVVRILTALPAQTMAAQLPGVLTTICNMLRAKAQSARNATRDTLIRIAKFLGPSYLGFIIKELDASLARGPQRHILSYTVYTLLKEMSRGIRVGELDYALPQIVEIMVEDVFGQVSEEKDAVEWTTKSKEARVHHGPDCFEILAALCSFDHIRLMLTPLRDILRETDTPKRTKAVDMVLRRISIGLNRNRMYSTSGILTFCHGIINQYLALSSKTAQETNQMKAMKETLAQRLKPSGDALVTVHMKRSDLSVKRDYLQANAYRFVQFGLDVVYYGLRRSKFDTRDAEVLGMLDPFVDLAGNALYSRYNSVITLGCKIWTMLVRLPLPSIAPGVPVVIKRLFAIFRQSSSTNSEMIQSCFKLLASVLRSKAAEDLMAGDNPKTAKDAKDAKDAKEKKKAASSKSLLTEEQLRDLIDFVRPDIEEPERQATAFNLIRAILTRRLIVDSLYTLLDTVRSLMITAQADNMRELCRLTWFQFLMDYPLGQRRLANAMSFIVQNATGYEFESGRTSALEIMGVIVSKFADEILLPTAAEPFFLGLVLIIAQDDSPKCREMATHLLPTLVARFDAQRLKRAWILLDQWSEGTAQSAGIVLEEEVESGKQAKVRQIKMRELGRAALQCYGIIAEPLGDRFTARVPALLASLDSALTISLRSWKQAEAQLNTATLAMISSEDDPQRTALVYWETAYAALNTFARFVSAPMYPTQWCRVDEHRRARIWLLAMQHLTHPHAWVRLSAARLFGVYVASADPLWMMQAEEQAEESAEVEWEVSEHKGDPRFVLMSVGRLRKLAHALVVQLSGEVVAPELGNQVVKNLYFIAKCFLTAVPAVTPVVSLVSADEQDVTEIQDNDEEEEEEDEEEDVKADRLPLERSLLWLINRMGRLARTELIRDQTNTTKRTYTFRYFAALTALLPAPILSQSPYLLPIISPLHRTSSSPDQLPTTTGDYPTAPVFNEQTELRDLASQVLRLVQERVGVTLFSSVLNKVQRHVEGVRLERRERRKQLALVDPELHAKRKFRKHENDRRRRQEKEADSAKRRRRGIDIIVRRAPRDRRETQTKK